MTGDTLTIGLLLFPRLTQLDMTGPFEVFKRLPGAQVHLVWKTLEPVYADTGLGLLPTTAIAACPKLDVICVPGGPGVGALMEDAEVLAFLRKAASEARYVTSVCTGALVLGAAGLLKGKRATTHWYYLHEMLKRSPTIAYVANRRFVSDGNVVTTTGISAWTDRKAVALGPGVRCGRGVPGRVARRT